MTNCKKCETELSNSNTSGYCRNHSHLALTRKCETIGCAGMTSRFRPKCIGCFTEQRHTGVCLIPE